jgi:hypothetical protein
MDTASNNVIKEDNKCCAKGCTKLGRLLLKINYINKIGYFCDSCAQDLLQQALAVETEGVNAQFLIPRGSNANVE